MDLGLGGKLFVVGGASRGLGRAVAENLVAEGARVILVARDEGALSGTARELGEEAHPLAADLSDPRSVDRIAGAVSGMGGELGGVLVNTGGPPPGRALELDDDQWLAAFGSLVAGPIRLLRALVPLMGDGASVLFVTSSSVRQPIPNLDASNVLRPGVAALTKCLARELAPRVRVNSLAPGRIDTERARSLDASAAEALGITREERRARIGETIPMGRYGEPAEFGRAAAFLLSPAASYVNGVSLQVDGGLVSALP
ncbi:SDR family oxidoreductase [Rubrobacter marinus]|uniref:SDR family oxidoreductase n=1 Tax=Rubrobacter marinus TaxID=2653852 RepID=A0A6G8Q0E4_9ACTN|nr:SDR family oxidoreductase [Rubrobacter marinus]QIN79941.1 SDR family oxidoreductase [Rubrobacter marinus]